jgi:hypothetical protein
LEDLISYGFRNKRVETIFYIPKIFETKCYKMVMTLVSVVAVEWLEIGKILVLGKEIMKASAFANKNVELTQFVKYEILPFRRLYL